MLHRILGFNKKRSPAHLLFLSKFLKPLSLDHYYDSDYWEPALEAPPKQVIRRFLSENLIEQVDLPEFPNYKYKVSDLKSILRELGLPVSGRKSELIQRLIENDPHGAEDMVRGLEIVQCTEKGRRIAERYLAQEAQKRASVEDQTFRALKKGKFYEASEMMAAFEARQVFSRGIGIDWNNYDPSRDVEMLEMIFAAQPNILSSLNNEQMEHLRPAAGMMYLWGISQATAWLPSSLETNLELDNDTAARMIMFYASHKRNIAGLRAAEAKTVKILSADDSCPSCKRLSESNHKISEVPELPYEKCTHRMGCRCRAILGDW